LKLRFLGTRGEIEISSPAHRFHSVLLVSYRARNVLVDCGADWLGRLGSLRPQAIVLTHAHPDHAGGLRGGATCPVYATAETWRAIERYPIREREVVAPRSSIAIRGLTFEAFALEHSLRAPAVGYRIAGGRTTVFYAPDVVEIHDRAAALSAVDRYVGDGASISRSIVRTRDGRRIGHASIRAQLEWCAAAGTRHAIFTHCGSQLVRGGEEAEARVDEIGRELGVRAAVARDGLELTVRAARPQ
jgi:phosphoribosyl 1,2-cyclic phosphodiesterase